MTAQHDEVTFVNKDVKSFVSDLKKLPEKDILLDGGSQLIQSFHTADVIDEMTISIILILLGDGIPLFLPFQMSQSFELVSNHSFSSGLVQITYQGKYQ